MWLKIEHLIDCEKLQQINYLKKNEIVNHFVENFFYDDKDDIIQTILNLFENYKSVERLLQNNYIIIKYYFNSLIDMFKLFIDLWMISDEIHQFNI